jgi:hypothetical protein
LYKIFEKEKDKEFDKINKNKLEVDKKIDEEGLSVESLQKRISSEESVFKKIRQYYLAEEEKAYEQLKSTPNYSKNKEAYEKARAE